MKKQATYPVYLNHLTMWEYANHKDSFEDYKQTVIMMLKIKDMFLFEDEIIEKKKDDNILKDYPLTMEAILGHFPAKYFSAGLRKRQKEDKEFIPTWFDLWADLEITPDFPYYDVLFCYKLRNTDLLELDSFLNYTLETYYENNVSLFNRFIQLALRKFAEGLLISSATIETVNEWMREKEKQPVLSKIPEPFEKSKRKGAVKRESGDNLTKLNQEQTALLFDYLQKGKLILKDEYLNNTQAGEAFAILTGYSANVLRQNFSKTELERIATKKNLTDLQNALVNLTILIKNELGGKK